MLAEENCKTGRNKYDTDKNKRIERENHLKDTKPQGTATQTAMKPISAELNHFLPQLLYQSTKEVKKLNIGRLEKQI